MPDGASALTPHAPILIMGDSEFIPANGVTGGSGTPGDPYIIEGWEINASAANGIDIRNTTSHFIVRNVYTHSGFLVLWYDGIYLHNTSNGRIENVTSTDNLFGVDCDSVENLTITGSNLSLNSIGIWGMSSLNVDISGNNITENTGDGMRIVLSTNTSITDNVLISNGPGIAIWNSEDSTVLNNSLSSNFYYGIHLRESENVTAIGNEISFHDICGLRLVDSLNVTLNSNELTSDGICLDGDYVENFNTHEISTDNLANGKPIYYFKNTQNIDVDGIPVGQVIIVNSSNANIANVQILMTDVGIQMAYADNVTVEGCTLSEGAFGMELFRSSNVSISWSEVSNYNFSGLYSHLNTNLTLSNNTITANGRFGAQFWATDDMTMIDNTITSNGGGGDWLWDGVQVGGGSSMTFIRNKVSLNKGIGISIISVDGATFSENEFTRDGIGMYVFGNQYLTYDISTDNLVNGNPVYYHKDCNGMDIDGLQIGQLILAGCSDVQVSNLSIGDTDWGLALLQVDDVLVTSSNFSENLDGIYISYSDNVEVSGTTVSNNSNDGISVYESGDMTLKGNNISFNQDDGIYLSYSSRIDVKGNNVSSNGESSVNVHGSDNVTASGNMFFGNGIGFLLDFGRDNLVHTNVFVENTIQAVDEAGNLNRWNVTYTGAPFGIGGNFWSDYSGPDQCKGPNQDDCTGWDGFGDIPYIIDSDSQDNYPLTMPFGAVPALDPFPPEVTITYPGEGQILTGSPVTVTGTASDEGVTEIVKVEVRANNESWIIASGTSNWHADVNLQPGQNRIEARSWESGERSSQIDSVEVFYDPPGNDPPIASFTIVPETDEANSAFTLNASSSWDFEDPVPSLEVRWDINNDGNWDTTWSTRKDFVIYYLLEGNYTIHLEVRDTGGLTNETFGYVIVTRDLTPPSPPTNLSVESVDEGSLLITWVLSDSMDVIEYNIYRSESEEGPFVQVGFADALYDDGDYFQDAGLQEGTTYWYYVTAEDRNGNESDKSIMASGSTKESPKEGEIWPWLVLSIVILMAILLAFILLRRRKEAETELSEGISESEIELNETEE
jgi:parallel beta-helix repeat protein